MELVLRDGSIVELFRATTDGDSIRGLARPKPNALLRTRTVPLDSVTSKAARFHRMRITLHSGDRVELWSVRVSDSVAAGRIWKARERRWQDTVVAVSDIRRTEGRAGDAGKAVGLGLGLLLAAGLAMLGFLALVLSSQGCDTCGMGDI
jgi:hypothetical protein